MNSIFKRRSIRKYKGDTLSEKQIEMLLRAGMAAPSAHNKQPWEFVITTRREILNELANKHPYAKMLKEAPLCIVVCANMEKQPLEGFFVQDCSAAIENILLQAQEMRLGGVWIGIYPHEELINSIKDIFEIPEKVIPISMMAIGYPDEHKHEITRYKEELIHIDKY